MCRGLLEPPTAPPACTCTSPVSRPSSGASLTHPTGARVAGERICVWLGQRRGTRLRTMQCGPTPSYEREANRSCQRERALYMTLTSYIQRGVDLLQEDTPPVRASLSSALVRTSVRSHRLTPSELSHCTRGQTRRDSTGDNVCAG